MSSTSFIKEFQGPPSTDPTIDLRFPYPTPQQCFRVLQFVESFFTCMFFCFLFYSRPLSLWLTGPRIFSHPFFNPARTFLVNALKLGLANNLIAFQSTHMTSAT